MLGRGGGRVYVYKWLSVLVQGERCTYGCLVITIKYSVSIDSSVVHH